MIWTVPNALTAARMLAAPALVLCFLLVDRPAADRLAFGLFIAAAVTDFFDGWLARRLGQVSALGRMLDPVADKAMVLIALSLLAATSRVGEQVLLPAALIILREVLVSGLREHLGGTALAVTQLAKVKTTLQMLAIGLLLGSEAVMAPAGPALGGMPDTSLDVAAIAGLALLWLAALVTLLTGMEYLRAAIAHLRAGEERR